MYNKVSGFIAMWQSSLHQAYTYPKNLDRAVEHKLNLESIKLKVQFVKINSNPQTNPDIKVKSGRIHRTSFCLKERQLPFCKETASPVPFAHTCLYVDAYSNLLLNAETRVAQQMSKAHLTLQQG